MLGCEVPVLRVGGVEGVPHQAVRLGAHAAVALRERAVQAHRGAQDARREFPARRPARRGACAPSSIRSRPSRWSPSCPGSPRPGGRAGSCPRCRSSAPRRRRPRYSLAMRRMRAAGTSHTRSAHSGGVLLHVRDELGEGRLAFERALGEHFAVGARFEAHVRFLRLERGGDDRPARWPARAGRTHAPDEVGRGGVADAGTRDRAFRAALRAASRE